MVMSTMPIQYAVPVGRARTRLLTALAARYTGGAASGRAVLDGFDTHPASQNSGRFAYPFGKTRILGNWGYIRVRIAINVGTFKPFAAPFFSLSRSAEEGWGEGLPGNAVAVSFPHPSPLPEGKGTCPNRVTWN